MDGDGSSTDLDISNDINGCIKSLDDDINQGAPLPGTKKNAPSGETQSSRSSSSSSSDSSDSSSSSSSKSSKASSSKKKVAEKVPEIKHSSPSKPQQPLVAVVTERILYPMPVRHYKKPLHSERSHKSQHRSRSRTRHSKSGRESGYRTDGSTTSDRSQWRRKQRAPSAPRSSAPIDLDLDLNVLQLSTEPSTSAKLTKKNVSLLARKNDTNNNTNNNKLRPVSLNLELNRRLLEHKMELNGRGTSSYSSFKNKGFKSSQSFQELTASSRVMAPSWTAEEKEQHQSFKPMKYAKSLPRSIKSRRTSVASRAGSTRSAVSSISRLRRATTTPAMIKNNEYVISQVAEITEALAKCSISSKRSNLPKVTQNLSTRKKKTVNKKKSKKNNIDNDIVPAAEEHKLPLKKRHYLINEEKTPNGVVKKKRAKKMAPPGVFEPTEQHDETSSSFEVFNISCQIPPETKAAKKSIVDNILTKLDSTGNRRKRRRANRTGFPTPKRPKKKVVNDNSSDTSTVIKQTKQVTRKPKVPKKEEKEVMPTSLSLRQLQLKQQKEIEANKEKDSARVQEVRNMRQRAKSVCHVGDEEDYIVKPLAKRKRRQTILIDHKDLQKEKLKETSILSNNLNVAKVPSNMLDEPKEKIEDRPIKKRRQTIHIDTSEMTVVAKKTKKEDENRDRVKIVPKNVYSNGDTQKRAFKPSLKGTKCRCSPNPCGESCLNRLMFIECDSSICGKTCSNTVIQTGGLLTKSVEKFMTKQKGYGVRTKVNIPKKTLILEYTGEVLFLEAFRQRMQTIYKDDKHHYCLELSGGLVLDGHRMGSLCRFVNHSCKPNCGMEKIYVDGLPRMILQAEEDILAGTELTYDYKFDNFEDMTPQQCFCGADVCRGTLSAQLKVSRRCSFSSKDSYLAPRKIGRKGRVPIVSAKNNHVFLVRNIRRFEHRDPKLMAQYRTMKNDLEEDPKIGFSFISSLRSQGKAPPTSDIAKVEESHKTEIKSNAPEKEKKVEESEQTEVLQPFTEPSHLLWIICEKLESLHKEEINQIRIPYATNNFESSNHDKISLPVTFEEIKTCVKFAHYDLHPLLFLYNMKVWLDNVVKYWGVNCSEFKTMLKIRESYKQIRSEMIEDIKRAWSGDEILVNAMLDKSIKIPPKNRKKVVERQHDEDIVNCHCGRYLEEGLMIQCQKCLDWQHVDCVGADVKDENYVCGKCDGKDLEMEIVKKDETTNDGDQCYLTLMRGDLQIRVGDAVYVLRDIPINPKANDGARHTYETIGEVNYTECDIVRVETLYKDDKGNKFVLGHHYLRPNEVYHEPTRKFYKNELMRTSIFESIPINLVIDTCWVLDPTNYFKGRPINSKEEHVYICEYKVDKQARVFSVIKKSTRQPISTKPYAFYKFEETLRQKRNHLPHDVDHVIPKKVKKEMQLQLKKEQSSERLQEPAETASATKRKTTTSSGKIAMTAQMKINKLEITLKKIKNVKKDGAKKNVSELISKPINHENSSILNNKSKAETKVQSATAKRVQKARKGRKAKKNVKTSIKIAKKPPEKVEKKKAGRKKKLRENENEEINQQ